MAVSCCPLIAVDFCKLHTIWDLPLPKPGRQLPAARFALFPSGKDLLNTYYVPDTFLGVEVTVKSLLLCKLCFWHHGGRTDNKERNK